MNVRVVRNVKQDEHGHVPEAGALQLCGVAGVEESLPRGAQVAVMQRLQDPPQVPAQTVIQTLPGDGQRVQQLLQAVVSAGHTQMDPELGEWKRGQMHCNFSASGIPQIISHNSQTNAAGNTTRSPASSSSASCRQTTPCQRRPAGAALRTNNERRNDFTCH